LIERINAGFLTDEVIAVSHDLKSLLVNFGIPPERITVVHNGIEPLIPLDSSKARALRSELGIAGNEKVVGTVGRLVPIKDHKTLLEGARIILEREPLTRFVIVGDGPDMDSLKNLACDLGIRSRVCFPGFRDDAADLLGLFDIFCLTSLHEGIPMALLEAMSLGLPIVATQVGGVKEVIHDNECGLLVPSRDARSFADACLRVLRNETTRERLSRNAMLRVREGFLLDRTVKSTQDIYGRSIQQ
jgi:glycosyltransferase involved in cell wall biosynthesis